MVRAWHRFAAALTLKDYYTIAVGARHWLGWFIVFHSTWHESESIFNEYEMRSAVTSDYNQ